MLCYISMIFLRFFLMVGNLLFFVYWLLDGIKFINEVQKSFRLSCVTFRYLPSYLIYCRLFFSFFFFYFYCSIYNFTNPRVDVYEANKDITNAKVMSELTWALRDGGQYSKILTE